MDSGCSFHMCPNIAWFQNFSNKESDTVYMGNNQSCSVQGIGDIYLKMHDNKIRMLTNVRYVPRLKRNLISLGTLDELGYSYKAENDFMHIFKNNDLILTGTNKHGLCVLNGCSLFPVDVSFACVVKSDKTDLWHLRLCHMSQKDMQTLSNQGYLNSVSACSLNFYEPSTLGKQHRLSFHKGTHLAKTCLEYLHADL